MSKSIVNSVVAKQLMTTLKDITGQLKTVADARESISHTPGYTVRIDEEKITPELLQRMNQVLIEFYVELSSGIIAEPKSQTYEVVQLPFPSSPSFQRRFFENLNRDEFGRFQPQQPFADSRQQVTDPSSFNEEGMEVNIDTYTSAFGALVETKLEDKLSRLKQAWGK